MFELPVNLRYLFPGGKKNSWFATAGVSSLLMKHQQYGYVYYYPTSGTSATYHKTYEDSESYLLSHLHVSGGMIHHLGFADLRIEPYLNIPVKGIGIGELPMMNIGLQAGLTRKLF
jgi:hypothetical protein